MNPYDGTFETKTLERLKFLIGQQISEELVEEIGVRTSVEFISHHLTNSIVARIRLDIFGEHLDRKTVTYPKTWLDGAKAALWAWFGTGYAGHWPWFGDYARKKWPARFVTVDIDVAALYSKISVPEYRPYVTVLRRESIDVWKP